MELEREPDCDEGDAAVGCRGLLSPQLPCSPARPVSSGCALYLATGEAPSWDIGRKEKHSCFFLLETNLLSPFSLDLGCVELGSSCEAS